MAITRDGIARLALGHLGTTTTVVSLDTDTTQTAKVARLFIDQVLEEVAEAFAWPWQGRRETLAMVETFTADGAEWAYSYRYPSDALAVRRILNGLSRAPSAALDIPYVITSDTTGLLLYCDLETPVTVEFTSRAAAADTSRFPPTYAQACARLLAHYAAPALTAGDPSKLAERNWAFFQVALTTAKVRQMGEATADQPAETPSTSARD